MSIEGINNGYLKMLGVSLNPTTGRYESQSSLLDFMGVSSDSSNSSEDLFQILVQNFEAKVSVNKMMLQERLSADLEATYNQAIADNPELEGNIVIAIVADPETNGLSVEVLNKQDVLDNIEDETERAEVAKDLEENPVFFVDKENISMVTPEDGAYQQVQKAMSDFIVSVKPIIEYLNT